MILLLMRVFAVERVSRNYCLAKEKKSIGRKIHNIRNIQNKPRKIPCSVTENTICMQSKICKGKLDAGACIKQF